MTQTDVTGSLLERYKDSFIKDHYQTRYSFRKELADLLTNKYSPNKNFTEENSKLLKEYETYFTWNEEYYFDFDASWYIEGDQGVRVCIDDRDEFLKLVNQDDEEIENNFENNGKLESAIDSTKYDGDLYLECEYTSYRDVSVNVFSLEPKKEVKTPPTIEESTEIFKRIFNEMRYEQKEELSKIPTEQMEEVVQTIVCHYKNPHSNVVN